MGNITIEVNVTFPGEYVRTYVYVYIVCMYLQMHTHTHTLTHTHTAHTHARTHACTCTHARTHTHTHTHTHISVTCAYTYTCDITLCADMNTEGTPQWFLKPHEMQSYGEISVDANGTGTAYCGAYRDEVNTTVEYRLCVTKPLVKQLDLTACYLEPTAMYSDLVCYPCQRLAPGAGVNLEPFDLTNHVGMVTAGCKVTSNTINQTYTCMAYRKNQSTEITSDYQLLGYFSFVPAVTPNTFSSPTIINTHRDLIIGLAVAVAGFLAIFICCCLCFCCCCCYKRKVGKLQVRLRGVFVRRCTYSLSVYVAALQMCSCGICELFADICSTCTCKVMCMCNGVMSILMMHTVCVYMFFKFLCAQTYQRINLILRLKL